VFYKCLRNKLSFRNNCVKKGKGPPSLAVTMHMMMICHVIFVEILFSAVSKQSAKLRVSVGNSFPDSGGFWEHSCNKAAACKSLAEMVECFWKEFGSGPEAYTERTVYQNLLLCLVQSNSVITDGDFVYSEEYDYDKSNTEEEPNSKEEANDGSMVDDFFGIVTENKSVEEPEKEEDTKRPASKKLAPKPVESEKAESVDEPAKDQNTKQPPQANVSIPREDFVNGSNSIRLNLERIRTRATALKGTLGSLITQMEEQYQLIDDSMKHFEDLIKPVNKSLKD